MIKLRFLLCALIILSSLSSAKGAVIDFMEELAEQGNLFAMKICEMYYDDIDKAKADEYKDLLYNVASAYRKGYGTEHKAAKGLELEDSEQASTMLNLKNLEEKAKKGDTDAMFILGRYYYGLDDYKKSLKWFEKCANSGNDQAMLNAAIVCNILKDYKKVNQWYEKAIAAGVPGVKYLYAKNNLPIRDEEKIDSRTNINTEGTWWDSYYHPYITEPEEVIAPKIEKYLIEEAEAGNNDAQLLLSWLYNYVCDGYESYKNAKYIANPKNSSINKKEYAKMQSLKWVTKVIESGNDDILDDAVSMFRDYGGKSYKTLLYKLALKGNKKAFKRLLMSWQLKDLRTPPQPYGDSDSGDFIILGDILRDLDWKDFIQALDITDYSVNVRGSDGNPHVWYEKFDISFLFPARILNSLAWAYATQGTEQGDNNCVELFELSTACLKKGIREREDALYGLGIIYKYSDNIKDLDKAKNYFNMLISECYTNICGYAKKELENM